MKILFNTLTGQLQPYPRNDDEAVEGLDPVYQVFDVIQDPPPIPVPQGYKLRPKQEINQTDKVVTLGFDLVAVPPICPNVQAFMAAFTLQEKALIALSTDPTTAALRLELTTWLSTVDPSHELVQTGLNKLVEIGIISEARKAEIIATATAN